MVDVGLPCICHMIYFYRMVFFSDCAVDPVSINQHVTAVIHKVLHETYTFSLTVISGSCNKIRV